VQGIAAFQWMSVITALLLGLGGLVRGVQMSKGNLDLISDWDNRQLPNPAEHASAFAHVYIRLGSVILISPIALWVGLPLLIWGVILAILVWYWFDAIERIAIRARRSS
jgi:Flp pilus assembly protein TadB